MLDAVGGISFSRWKGLLRRQGRLLMVAGGFKEMLQQPWIALTRDVSLIAGMARERAEDLNTLAELAATGFYRPHIDRVYPLIRIREAHAYVDSGRKRGSVVVDLS